VVKGGRRGGSQPNPREGDVLITGVPKDPNLQKTSKSVKKRGKFLKASYQGGDREGITAKLPWTKKEKSPRALYLKVKSVSKCNAQNGKKRRKDHLNRRAPGEGGGNQETLKPHRGKPRESSGAKGKLQ